MILRHRTSTFGGARGGLLLLATFSLGGCVLFPSFDPALLDAGLAAREGGSEASVDASAPDVARMDVLATDAAPETAVDVQEAGVRGGFTGTCLASDPTPNPTFQRVGLTQSGAQDFAFDPRGTVAIVGDGRTSVLVDTSAMATALSLPAAADRSRLRVRGGAWMPSGQLALTVLDSAGLLPSMNRSGLALLDLSSTVTVSALYSPPAVTNFGDVVVAPSGRLFFVDADGRRVLTMLPTDVSPVQCVSLSSVLGAVPLSLALSPDGTRLAVGLSSGPAVFLFDVDATGRAVGASTPVAQAQLPDTGAFSTALAFDSCGRLYALDGPRGLVFRSSPDVRTFALAFAVQPPPTGDGGVADSGTGGDGGVLGAACTGMAFGQGAGFGQSNLYFLQSNGDVLRADLGFAGAPITAPTGSGGGMDAGTGADARAAD